MTYELIKLNTARNCLRYVIRAFRIKELYVPYYICSAVRIAASKEDCQIIYYHINTKFEPQGDLPKSAYILYPNYFGVCSDIVNKMDEEYPNLIVDNAHSFFSEPKGIASFNSIRKFFPYLRDGAFLYTKSVLNEIFPDSDYKYELKELDYKDFIENEARLDSENILLMSDCTLNYFNKVDINKEKERILNKFNNCQKKYGQIKISKGDIPYKYPILKKTDAEADTLVKELESEGSTIFRYWHNLPQNFPEYSLYKRLVAI